MAEPIATGIAIAKGTALANFAAHAFGYGICLGIGFWAARKVTDKLDELINPAIKAAKVEQLRLEAIAGITGDLDKAAAGG